MAKKKRASSGEDADHKSTKRRPPAEVVVRITRSDTKKTLDQGKSDAARVAVIKTSELLEQILLELPPRQLFIIQRVNKRFQQVIGGTTSIQQRMHLRPALKEPIIYCVDKDVYDRDPDRYMIVDEDEIDELPADGRYTPVDFSPVFALSSKWNPMLVARLGLHAGQRPPGWTDYRPDIINEKTKAVKVRSRQTWHDTYLTQPPCQEVRATLSFKVGGDYRTMSANYEVFVVSEAGVTCGDLITAALRQYCFRTMHTNDPADRTNLTVDETLRLMEEEKGIDASLYVFEVTDLAGVKVPSDVDNP